MRFSSAVAVVLLGISVSGLAQQPDTFKVKRSPPEKAAKPIMPPTGKTRSATAAGANAKDLQNIENQTKKISASKAAGTRASGKASALKPVKDKPNPPINFSGTSGAKRPGTTNQGSNPYKGRLRQKHSPQ
ncbi:MAG: hypothetical protein WCA13_14515 [Terriglobales bacterium]